MRTFETQKLCLSLLSSSLSSLLSFKRHRASGNLPTSLLAPVNPRTARARQVQMNHLSWTSEELVVKGDGPRLDNRNTSYNTYIDFRRHVAIRMQVAELKKPRQSFIKTQQGLKRGSDERESADRRQQRG